jgi:hypothetical protein
MGVQGRQPLTVRHVGLPARHVLHVPTVDHQNLKPSRLKHFISTQPVDSGGFHRNTFNTPLNKIPPQILKVCGHRPEHSWRISSNRHVQILTAHIDSNSFLIQNWQCFHSS